MLLLCQFPTSVIRFIKRDNFSELILEFVFMLFVELWLFYFGNFFRDGAALFTCMMAG